MLKRFELHNHTTESDALINCEQLLQHMEQDGVDAFALTDHNTISGHRIIQKLLAEGNYRTKCLYGMEYTTYFGHIVCPNLKNYVPWDSINRHHPELLFQACRNSGALAGIAHPFSYGDPFARGCRFEMTVTDFSCVDFIEIFNNPEPLHEVNEKGLLWWEELTLKGEKLAITAGMDLHELTDMSMKFATYAEGEPDGDVESELIAAIRSQSTWISKGMVLRWERTENGARFWLEDVRKPGFIPAEKYIMTLKSSDGVQEYDITSGEVTLTGLPQGTVIPKLYSNESIIENLICVSPAIYA